MKLYSNTYAYNKDNYSYNRNPIKSINNLSAGIPKTVDSTTFKGLYLSEHNKSVGKEIIRTIKNDANKNFVILPHKNSDIDAIGGCLALAHLIQKKTNKRADIFIEKPLQDNYQFIDPHRQIKVISDILGMGATEKEITKKFGTYDCSISLDTAHPGLHDERLFNVFFKNAKNTRIDIDHHTKNKGQFADITLVDPSKKSCTQLIMEFFQSMSTTKKPTKAFSDAIIAGLAGDTDNFMHADKNAIKDLNILKQTSNPSNIMCMLKQKSMGEIMLCSEIIKNTKFADNGDIAYSIFDTKGRTYFPEKIVGMALSEISKINNVKYYFVINKNSKNISNNNLAASIRSADHAKPIQSTIEKLDGGGHARMCGIHTNDKNITAESMCESVLKALIDLNKS